MSSSRRPNYVSPFVADALYRAQLRAQAKRPLHTSSEGAPIGPIRPVSAASVDSSKREWDSHVAKNDLFDSTLHKQDIFKIAPRVTRQQRQPVAAPSSSPRNTESPMKLTMRRQEVGSILYSFICSCVFISKCLY